MANRESMTGSDLDYLRKESLWMVLFCMTVVLYLWCIILFQPINLQPVDRVGAVAWGPALLAGGLAIAFAVQRRSLSLAAAAAIAGMATAILSNMWVTDANVAPYVLAVVVSLSGLLFGMKTVIGVTVLCSVSVVAVGSLHWGDSPFAAELLSPVLVIGAVGALSSLAVRNLYLALYWALDHALAAQRSQEELRDRQAELARLLKALETTYKRIEHLNYDLARARKAAEEARLIKQQFVTNVSHELRVPLNVIVAFSEMMYLSPESYGGIPLPAEYRGDVREIYRSSRHLLRLIDDVLDMSQIEAGQMRIYLESVELHEVISEALGVIRPLLRGKDIILSTSLPEDLPPVSIDRARVRQVLLNLLNNARRFTDSGRITLQASLEEGQVRVTVADTGIGIPPSEHEKVFEEFRQLDGSITRRQDGSGLGLAISKRFVEMHGGHIWLESDGVPGHGSRFHFTLPLAEAEPFKVSTSYRTPEPPLRRPSGRGRTLLLLDQDSSILRTLEKGLEEYQVVPVEDISEVPALIDELHPRAVVLNLAQRKRARQQLRELRRMLGQSSLPIALCPLVGERQLGQSLGVADYLVKPITREALTALLGRLDESVHRILVVDDDPRMARILSRVIQATGRDCRVIRAYEGQEGLREMRRQHPDLVLLDLVMPGIDGYSVLTQMRKDAELCHIPVAVITAHTHTPEEERRLGGRMLSVYAGAGFTNEEALICLRSILDAVAVPSPLHHSGQIVQRGQQVSLGDGLAQVSNGAQ
jgi:signal transduction histidine kinase/DNA-binding response OmpR family regulator